MANNIVEADQPMGTAAAVIEKKARQLVYDARYEVKGALGGKKVDAATLERMIMDRIRKSSSIPAVKTRAAQMVSKKPVVKETYIPEIKDAATTSVAKALLKVFVEGVDPIIPDYLEELKGLDDKKYKIRVTDPKTGNSYVRYGTREKITQLRSQGLKVELTEYGDPREGEAKRGEDTARATGGGRRANKDYDGDGKVESSSKEHAGAVHNAIQRATGGTPDGKDTRKTVSASYEPDGDVLDEAGGRHGGGSMVGKPGGPAPRNLPGNQERIDANKNGKIDANDFKLLRAKKGKVEEEFLADGTESTEGKNTSKITGKGVDNYASGVVTISPKDGSQSDVKGPQSPRGIFAHTELDGKVILETGYAKFLKKVQDLEEMSVSINQQQAAGAALSAKRGKTDPSSLKGAAREMYDSMTEKQLRDFAKTKHKGLPEKVEEECGCDDQPKMNRKKGKDEVDPREIPTKLNLVKNKLRSMGAKNPIVMMASEEVVDEARALGRAGRDDDNNPRGAAVRASSGRGMTMTPARGLGASKPKGDDKARAAKQAAQAKADRRAAARDRAAEGEDRLSRLVRSVQNSSYEPEGEVIDERTRERKGQPRPDPSSLSHRVMMDVRNRNKEGVMTRSGRTVAQHERERGVSEKDRPQPTTSTPADRLKAKKSRAAADAQRAQDMYKPRAGESD